MKLIRVRSDDSVEIISVPKIFDSSSSISIVEIYQEKYKLHTVVATCNTMVYGIKIVTLYNKELSVVSEYNKNFLSTTGTALLDAGEINVDGKVQHIVVLCTNKNIQPVKIMIDGMKISLSDADIEKLTKGTGNLISLAYSNDMQLYKVYSNGVASKAYLLCYNSNSETIVKTISLMNLSGELMYNYDVTVNTLKII